MTYEFFKQIDDPSNLAKFFNLVFKKLTTLRIIFAPSSYASSKVLSEKDEDMNEYKKGKFYDLCLGELYLHSIIDNLNRWEKLLKEYNGEFQSSWRYYAASKRMDSIKKYGGEDDDYDESGNIKTVVGDWVLERYSILSDLVYDDWRDIFLQTEPFDILNLINEIIVEGKVSIVDIVKDCFGKKIPTYRLEDGEMIENTFADELIDKIESEDDAYLKANTLFTVCTMVWSLINAVRDADKRSDNQEFLSQKLPKYIQKLLDLKVVPVDIFKQEE